jgi:sugar lactone lactonase YvrE
VVPSLQGGLSRLRNHGLALALAIASSACHDDRTLGEIIEANLPGAGPGADAGADTSGDAQAPEAGAPDGGAPDATTVASCDNLPTNVPYKVKRGPKAAADFVFDRDGMLISVSGGRVWKTPFSGQPTLFLNASVGIFGDQSHGTRLLPNGDLVISTSESASREGLLLRIPPDGRASVLASGFDRANAIEVDLQGFVYVAEMSRKQVVRVDGATGAATVLVNGNGLELPYGVTFSPDYRTLYIGERTNGSIFALEVQPDGTAGAMRVLARDNGAGLLDGMAVDACGNVYVSGFDSGQVYRVAPDGGSPQLVADLSDLSLSIPNMQWGSGTGGWDPSMLYVIDQRQDQVYELHVRVRGKRAAHLVSP